MNTSHTRTLMKGVEGGGLFTQRSSALDHRLATNDPERPLRPQRGSLIEQRMAEKFWMTNEEDGVTL
ncbi:hypothetical protein CDAR_596751 [Caerostris darwini]|uniref:Uncharacterized protein n=1 Tax=Caerostris darwini TaxID=1538125 RepID=A0AAV4WDP8_9ARAC|nr:hypothetical protein CDAR_596751 [Caerostris darwini]